MKTERIIRSQARESLKGNWTAAVAGVFVLLSVIFISDAFYSLLGSLTGIFDGEKLRDGSDVALMIILCATFVLTFLLTPFKNGYFRLCYNIACGKSDGLRDMFYFFSRINKYFKALQFNIIISLKRLLYTLICFIPYIACRVFEEVLFAFFTKPTASTNVLFDVLETVLIVIGIILAVIVSIRLLIAEFVFVDNCEANVFDIARTITKRHLGDYYKLCFSFIFWILSCILVLPGLYVIPYFTTSLGTTSKWLINLYKEGKTV